MGRKEREKQKPLNIEAFKQVISDGLKGTETFWQQFDVFELSLKRSGKEKYDMSQYPYIAGRVEFHIPPNTPVPIIQNQEMGRHMNEAITETINKTWKGLFINWEPGFSGGNTKGWDMNYFGILSRQADELQRQISPEDKDIVLVRYEKPENEPRNRKLSNHVAVRTFTLNSEDGPIIIGPDGATTLAEIQSAAEKARRN